MSSPIVTRFSRICDAVAKFSDISDFQIRIKESVAEVDIAAWGSVVAGNNSFLCLDYLSALEDTHDEGLELRYALFYLNEKPIGAAAFQITHFTTSEDAYAGTILRFINRVVSFFRGKHIHNILICGNAIATGEHGFCFNRSLTEPMRAALIARAMKLISNEEDRKGRRICAMVVKDFYPPSAEMAEHFAAARFRKFQVDHNMVMPLSSEWKSFDDYLGSMNTKFRTKAKAAINRSSKLISKESGSDEIKENLAAYERLYENVHLKADFRLGRLNLKTLNELLIRIPGKFVVRSYYLGDELIGFMTAMQCGSVLEAHVIGIDYEKNKEYALYQRMLYDYVALGISRQCSRIVFGRTAAEIKSTVGALPVDLTCCILHQRRASNALLSLILHYVKPSVYPQREPFKVEVREELNKIKLYE